MSDIVVKEIEAGVRLDKFLPTHYPHLSRSLWQSLIRQQKVLVNDVPTTTHYIVRIGNRIWFDIPNSEPVSLISSNLDLDILYEDESVVVINKPIGLITHPAHANTVDSVAQRIIAHAPKTKLAVYDTSNPVSLLRPGIVHRLDKDTSGVMIVAKNTQALTWLAKQIQNRKVSKIYTVLLFGWLEESPIEVNTWLNRDTANRRKMMVTPHGTGREATTIFTAEKRLQSVKGDRVTLANAELITGRTHQIRVHAAHIGHPVIGDPLYGSQESKQLSQRLGLHHQFLHASSLSIRLPHKRNLTEFSAPLPKDLEKVLLQFH